MTLKKRVSARRELINKRKTLKLKSRLSIVCILIVYFVIFFVLLYLPPIIVAKNMVVLPLIFSLPLFWFIFFSYYTWCGDQILDIEFLLYYIYTFS